MSDFRQRFLAFAHQAGALQFGQFTTKSGRQSPYFFNTGRFADGAGLAELGASYAEALLASGLAFDGLYGPAYKGIPLVATLSIALAARGVNLPYSFNRKEAKDHGEGGVIVGSALAGRVLIVDDVITAGTSVRESVQIIRAAGATPAGVLITLDRKERGQGSQSSTSAVQEVQAEFNIPVIAIATVDDVLAFTAGQSGHHASRDAILAYRSQYGIS